VGARPKTWVCGRSHGCLSLLSDVEVEVSATGRAIVQRSHTECGMSECDRETLSNEEAGTAVEPWKNTFVYTLLFKASIYGIFGPEIKYNAHIIHF
jgi:hypothetical protein